MQNNHFSSLSSQKVRMCLSSNIFNSCVVHRKENDAKARGHGIPCIALEDMIEPRRTICVSRSFSKEITTLQELGEQVANFAESAVTKLRGQGSVALEIVVFAMTNRFKQDAPQTYYTTLWSDIPKTSVR